LWLQRISLEIRLASQPTYARLHRLASFDAFDCGRARGQRLHPDLLPRGVNSSWRQKISLSCRPDAVDFITATNVGFEAAKRV